MQPYAGVRLGAGAVDADAATADDTSSPFMGVGRLRVWGVGFMLNCGVRGRLRGRLYRHSRLTMEKRRRRIARLKTLQICTRTTPSRCRRRRRRISARKYFMIPVDWRQGCRRKKSVWLTDTKCGTMQICTRTTPSRCRRRRRRISS
jgi:hypothetical protein